MSKRFQSQSKAKLAPSSMFTRAQSDVLQCCSTTHVEPLIVPPIVHDVLHSPGQPLDPATRALMEPRLGHDFSQVRVHADSKAADSARAVHALAYTAGRDVVFGEGEYVPATMAGRKLLSHELAHVIQQSSASVTMRPWGVCETNKPLEQEAEVTAENLSSGQPPGLLSKESSPQLRRTIEVKKPKDDIPNPGGKGIKQTNAETIDNYMTTLCPTGSVTVDPSSGDISIPSAFCTRPPATIFGITLPWTTASPAEESKTPTGCGCICDLVYSKHQWTIIVHDSVWPRTEFTEEAKANGLLPGGSGGVVFVPSPNSLKLWGAATASGKELDIDPWLVLGHELCGHGWLGNFGKHGPDVAKKRGEGGHQATVARENELRKEHGIDLRGTFKDPNCGESYWRDKKKPGTVNWSIYRDVCQKWRDDYNKMNHTHYKITDRIP